MKILLSIVLVIFLNPTLKSQCTADAGPDQTLCNYPQGLPLVQLGGNPTAPTGTPPFTYTWETSHTISIGSFSHTYFASDFLDDTTIANPSFIHIEGDSLQFILTVTDFENNSCKDTVFVRASHFAFHLGQFGFTIQLGDSIFLNPGTNVWSSNGIVTVLWHPIHGLSDSTSLAFWAKPDTSVAYSVTITDSLGCSLTGGAFVFVNVLPVSVEENSNLNKILVYPNPFAKNIIIKLTSDEEFIFQLFNSDGKTIFNKRLKNKMENISIQDDLKPGIYFYKLVGGNSHYNGKLIRL